MNKHINESLEGGDLKRLVHDEIHIDEYKSKLGDDKDVIVVSFKVHDKEPANDLVSFIEKGYDWVIDSDVSSGEMNDGDYIVFVELPRDKRGPERIVIMIEDIVRLTEIDVDEWRVRYYKDHTNHDLSVETLTRLIPLSPEEYDQEYGRERLVHLDKLKTAAGVKVDTKAPKNPHTESLRVAAGIL
jgi:hypothetical protein